MFHVLRDFHSVAACYDQQAIRYIKFSVTTSIKLLGGCSDFNYTTIFVTRIDKFVQNV